MIMGASVQFFGRDNIAMAYDNRKCIRWAIFQGSQFLFKYDGDDLAESEQLFSQIIDSLDVSGSDAVYTCKFYEDKVKIKNATPYDGSFNFKMITPDAKQERGQLYAASSQAILAKLTELETRLDERENDQDDDDGSINGILSGLLREPEKLGQLINAGKALFAGTGTRPAAMVNGVPDQDRITKVIDRLLKNDPKIIDHLEKLADLAENEKSTFDYLLSMLEKM